MRTAKLSDGYSVSSSEDDFDEDLIKKKHIMFTSEDDEKLKNIVEEYYLNDLKKINWTFVSSLMSNKNRRQCKDRYINYLRDGLNYGKFTKEENYLLLCKVEEFGNKWKMIAKFFKNRTDVMIKAQYRKLMRRHATIDNVIFINVDTHRRAKYQRKHFKENKSQQKTEIPNKNDEILNELEFDDEFLIDKYFQDPKIEEFSIF
ncbi:Myb-like DNA-binding domain containing protein [Trichomonas vaginalis G3]|uniref:Myb-like DNA-binding domain containing protein n=1 Tax=Trichomonas vaginalis (strain ATCC PRA-98 / G3) TaxID=412133 RepID=A2E617_TRIV3|nr:RNA polymerase II transcription regulator recruiting protein [Trichomonas vaginalis G3]EAY11859.1 Myb-like DNA-binding domain containing protein [Trichomonas vaginalis G3]KAI5532269.1 RNA polymerase II transcription regulator recruiting protein [Trichomonas vaginalis G3]|eukprot:XP_001324082.1 Myb-like DNA-binding domain containing protein [Trichomonas vaginalis G3]